MRCSNVLVEKIKQFEGCRLKSYRCPAGVVTIGYGHTGGLRMGMGISLDKANMYLDADIEAIESVLKTLKLPPLTLPQWEAIVDFVFNLGFSNFKKSTLCRKIKTNPKDVTIPNEFRRWVYSKVDGKTTKLEGLVKRREWEARRWATTIE